MKYCVECGTKLKDRFLKQEGMIPYCEKCKQFRFPIYSTAVSMIVMNSMQNKILLIKQYGKDRFILVAGYVNKGETAENAVSREVLEELGLTVDKIKYNKSEFFGPSNTLILNFTCTVTDESLENITEEVDYAEWFNIDDAKENIMNNSLAERFLLSYLN